MSIYALILIVLCVGFLAYFGWRRAGLDRSADGCGSALTCDAVRRPYPEDAED